MRCSGCGAENVSDRRFCAECGAPLAVVCPACGFEKSAVRQVLRRLRRTTNAAVAPPAVAASPESYTPKPLAERILRSRGALEGERKQVTVLFADIKGSNHPNDIAMRNHASARRERQSTEALGFHPSARVPPAREDAQHGHLPSGERTPNVVCNEYGQTHDIPNLFVSDGSQFTSGGAENPTLTIVGSRSGRPNTGRSIKQEGDVAGAQAMARS